MPAHHDRHSSPSVTASPFHLVCSFPKSGRTWLRFALFTYIRDLYKIDVPIDFAQSLTLLPNWDRHTTETWPDTGASAALLPAIRFHHFLPLEEVRKRLSLGEQRSPRRIMILRPPRQTLVSAYHHYRDFMMLWQGDFHDFLVRSPWGLDAYVAYHNAWSQTLAHEPASLVLSYEQMKADFRICLENTVKALDLPLDESRVNAACQMSTIENMRRIEQTFGGLPGRSPDADTANPNAQRVRVGSDRPPDLPHQEQQLFNEALRRLSGQAIDFLSENGVDLDR